MNDALTDAKRKTLIIPMEIIERELYGNLLLALEAVKRGWQVILGTKRSIFDAAHDLPDGVAFLKSIMACEIHNMRDLKAAGHKLACLDVEGLVYTSLEEFVTTRFATETVEEIELGLFWGDCQRGALQKAFPAHAQKFKTTGTPIVDLWRPAIHPFFQDRVRELKDRYGPYILIPSSFSSVNHYMGEKGNTEIIKRDGIVKEEEREEFFKFWSDYEKHVSGVFHKFLTLLPGLSRAFPDHKIIVRPHPSESHQKWKDAAKDLSNVTVIFEGVVSPWILGADAILHWGCTTGVEGYLMGRPVVAYNPVTPEDEKRFDHTVPHSISIMARTPAETIEALRHVVARPHDVLDDYPAVCNGEKYLREWIKYSDARPAAVEVLDQLETISIPANALKPIPKTIVPLREYIWRMIEFFTQPKFIRTSLPKRIQHGLESRAYGRHKTRGVDFDHVRSAVEKLGALRGIENVSVRSLGKNIVWLGPIDRSAA